jgi:ribose 5-phosphate isomerase
MGGYLSIIDANQDYKCSHYCGTNCGNREILHNHFPDIQDPQTLQSSCGFINFIDGIFERLIFCSTFHECVLLGQASGKRR